MRLAGGECSNCYRTPCTQPEGAWFSAKLFAAVGDGDGADTENRTMSNAAMRSEAGLSLSTRTMATDCTRSNVCFVTRQTGSLLNFCLQRWEGKRQHRERSQKASMHTRAL